MAYCCYLRKSRADRDAEMRGEGETLARHRAMLQEYADRNGIVIDRVYSEVVSGESIASRPVIQELLSDVECGMWDGVLVVEVERLARGNTKDQGIIADTFKYSNTKIITPTKTYDPDNEFDEEYFEFGLFMSRREYKTINRRLQRGRIASVKEGKFVCSTAPFGYKKIKIPHDKGYTLEIIPEQAKIVRQIFDWYCYGEQQPDGTMMHLGTDHIATRLDTLGVKPIVSQSWSKASISDMLKNPTYAGYVFFGRQKEVKSSVNGNIIKIRKSNPDFLLQKGMHPAIITEDQYEYAQKVRKVNKKNTVTSASTLQNPLSGIVYCNKCKKMMTRLGPNSRNPYATLKCPNKYCDNVSSPIFLVEEQILQFLRDWLASYELAEKNSPVIPFPQDLSNLESAVQRLESEKSTLSKQLNRAYDLLEQEIYTVEIFRSRKEALEHDIAVIDQNISSTMQEIQNYKRLQEEKALFVPKVRNLLDTYASNSVETNNQILRDVIEKIYYEKSTPNRKGQLHNANFSLQVYPRIPKVPGQ